MPAAGTGQEQASRRRCAAIVQLTGYRLKSLRAQTLGLAVMIPGLVALVVADRTQMLAWLLAATVLAGTGMGLAFMGSLGDVNEIAPQDRKGDVVAALGAPVGESYRHRSFSARRRTPCRAYSGR